VEVKVDKLDLVLDPSNPDFRQVESEITQYLQSLEKVSYQQSKTSPAPGTLHPVDAETVRISVELVTSLVSFITAIALIVSQVRASSPKTTGPSVRLRVKDLELSLPASEGTVKKFIASLTSPPKKQGTRQSSSKKPSSKKKRRKPNTPRPSKR
jgi:hypothetical protein